MRHRWTRREDGEDSPTTWPSRTVGPRWVRARSVSWPCHPLLSQARLSQRAAVLRTAILTRTASTQSCSMRTTTFNKVLRWSFNFSLSQRIRCQTSNIIIAGSRHCLYPIMGLWSSCFVVTFQQFLDVLFLVPLRQHNMQHRASIAILICLALALNVASFRNIKLSKMSKVSRDLLFKSILTAWSLLIKIAIFFARR